MNAVDHCYDALHRAGWSVGEVRITTADRPAWLVSVTSPLSWATVVIDEPQVAHLGGTVAAPLFRRVMEQSDPAKIQELVLGAPV